MKNTVFLVLSGALMGVTAFLPAVADNRLAGASDADSLLEMLGALAEEQVAPAKAAEPQASKAESAAEAVTPVEAAVTPVGEVVTPVEEAEPVEEEPVAELATEGIEELAAELESTELPAAAEDSSRPTKITSRSAVYNRKEGLASFAGKVHLDDPQYQLHADRVYVFTTASNELKRVVALGNVALTNETRCAYGAKATYSRPNGLVVLYSGDGITAEVVDNSKEQPQSVKGEKIRFWIDSEQVEVLNADISGPAPAGKLDANALKKINTK